MNPDNYQQSPQYPQQPQQQSPQQPPSGVRNPLEAMRPGEQIICEIKRHPIGIYGTYVMAGIMIVAALVAALAMPMFVKGAASSLYAIVWGVCLLIGLVAFVMIYVGTKVYWGNRWIVTSDSITQTLKVSLFDTQSSQLSMGNIEDVTVEEDGVLCHMFGYGMLRVETAGEHSKFVFPFCPTPNVYAQKILNTREDFEQGRRGEDQQRLYRSQGTYAPPYPEQPQYEQQQPPQYPQYAQQPVPQPGDPYQQMPPQYPMPPQEQENPMPPNHPPYGGGMPEA